MQSDLITRQCALDASDLITSHGDAAAFEAAARAERSRDVGNLIHFCRWRRVERLIGVLAAPEAATLH